MLQREERRWQHQQMIEVADSSEEEGRPGSSGLAAGRGLEAPEEVQPPGQPPQGSREQPKGGGLEAPEEALPPPGQPPQGSQGQPKEWRFAQQAKQLDQQEAVQVLAAQARGRGMAAFQQSGVRIETAMPCMISSWHNVFAPNLQLKAEKARFAAQQARQEEEEAPPL